MLISWNWLKQYVSLDMSPEELTDRLMMAGLNHESTTDLGGDLAIDLEVTSNRPDCLGHIGIARETSVLWGLPLQLPAAAPPQSAPAAQALTSVALESPDLCHQYTARVIRGVQVKPSPAWLADRLKTVGIAVVNNVVDITNYVLFECGQPLHAFDLARLNGRRIVVRAAHPGESFLAIDHRTYALDPGMCVIADATRPVAIGGIMGGAETEVSSATTELLIEAAEFAPLSIRGTARKLNLHSPSSYRFERGVDPAGVDWASRRCCELILELAGGQLAEGVVTAAVARPSRPPIVLRWGQIKRVLGIDIPADATRRILAALGNRELAVDASAVTVSPPSWRRDLSREIDLVEEVARVHGYHAIPEDVHVPMVPSHRTDRDRVLSRVRAVLTAAGFDEAMTVSVVREEMSSAFSPWTDAPPLVSATPILRGANCLRRSLVPSLLEARRINESLANPTAELFETAAIYLPRPGQLPVEQWSLGLVSGGGFAAVKGAIESLVSALCPEARLTVAPTSQPLLHPDRGCELQLDGARLAVVGELTPAALKSFGLRWDSAAGEVDLSVLAARAQLVRKHSPLSPQPAIARDVNLVVDESVRWSAIAETAQATGGEVLEAVRYQETYRDAKKDGPNKKRLLFTLTLRAADRTLTSEEADGVRDRVVAACRERHGATLLA